MKGENIVKEIRFLNFRSLKDTGLQKLTPVTILVGENSSGKSTFLRTFPLLKQSINKRTAGPILWSGDIDDYVDFGSFDETVTNDHSNLIGINFKFVIPSQPTFKYISLDELDLQNIDVDYNITITSKDGKETVSIFELKLNNTNYHFDISKKTVCIDNETEIKISEENEDEDISNQNTIMRFGLLDGKSTAFGFSLPSIKKIWKEIKSILGENYDLQDGVLGEFSVFQLVADVGERIVCDTESSLNNLFKELPDPIVTDDTDEQFEYEFEKEQIVINNKIVDAIISDKTKKNCIKLLYAYWMFQSIDDYLVYYYKNVHYIAPLRATAERYYRLRNLAIDEIDYQGKNLAIFINSLSTEQIKQFNDWTLKNFGFSVNTGKSQGHLSLKIKLNNSRKSINLSDTGFGYSQVLPIITQLWELSTRTIDHKNDYNRHRSSLIPLVVAIEQPELHLHPAMQAKLAKAFIASIKLAREHGYQLQLILETHSETIVNYFGRAICRKQINAEDVSVILFDKDKESGLTIVKNSVYDTQGYLENWPYGFFDSEE